ncbi:hypothetical protein MRB53_035835 [Persea americana]|uniref:Uncharacterized protein n=1 Tax=Persea americana TaxID=3435 RepID=A0ACC2K5R0_PERAE|nr:hypothetical protein MRB53_035835 [Persea americana]
MSGSTSFFYYYSKKLLFFIRIRRLLKTNTTQKNMAFLEQKEKTKVPKEEEKGSGVVREVEVEDGCFVLQRSVKKLHFGDCEEKEIAAKEIKRLARKDLRTRKSLAVLGVIPTLVSMLDSEVSGHRESSVQALIELANGTYTNKALMVESGILSKLPQLIGVTDLSRKQEFAILLLSISSLASTQFPIPSSDVVLPFLVEILDSDTTDEETKAACLATLYNFSTILDHVLILASCGTVVHTLLRLSSEKETSERSLATLGNLVVTMVGKKAMEDDPMVPKCFIQIIAWEEKPRCQELATYILMILAHRSSAQRKKMAELGIVPALLEVALLGGPLAQKRALRILQWFKDERYMKVGAHSGPQTGRGLMGSPMNEKEIKEGRNAIKKMVKQSLDKNMELIMRRANAEGNAPPLKGLVVSSSSKSLPY